jgi:arabinofuranosyltransferase
VTRGTETAGRAEPGAGTTVLTAADDPEVRPPSRWSRLALASPAYLPAVMIAVGGWQHRWMDEDAFINLRIVDQIFAGHGPVFNAGERVEAATSTVWLAVLVVGRLVFGAFASMEWITLIASLLAAVAAFVVAGKATRLLHRGEGGAVVPVGMILVASVAVVWDFATSGLEMGLVWLWIAASWYVLVSVARAGNINSRKRAGFAIVLGLAPLVRPDLGLMMVLFVVAWFVLVRPRRIVFDLVALLALPVAYQVFRMGYYATIVPSTALAKDAGALHVGQGWTYATNFIDPYRLWVTGIFVALTIGYRSWTDPNRRIAVATAAMVGAGIVHALYIIAIGGDYIHGRLLLPAFFAIALPASVAVQPITARTAAWSKRAVAVVGIGVLAIAWTVLSVVKFRPPPVPKTILLSPISDWRTVSGARLEPIDSAFGLNGNEAAAAYKRGVRGYFKIADKEPLPARDPNGFYITMGSIGVPAYDAGRRVFVIDIGGLAEPLAARTDAVPGRAAGHRKQVDEAWYDARFGSTLSTSKDEAARHALTCGPIPGLLEAVDAKMTPGRFFSNIFHSFGYTRLKIPADPVVAEQKFCPPSR